MQLLNAFCAGCCNLSETPIARDTQDSVQRRLCRELQRRLATQKYSRMDEGTLA